MLPDEDIIRILDKWKCSRCGYNEFKSSLHFHHRDGNSKNNNPDNFLVICANCHLGLHHKRWNITELKDITIDDEVNKLLNPYIKPLKRKGSPQ